ncbi:DNA-3-methyladenine glycosylase family protein [Sabulicella rubraurantiaca]|uniref:DNA-3-methyladenine glycosylase family protein n=1 Tax=Sabulicella rubraurantiaca TaxID=2811429 RepID=UPI001A95F3FF|nr:DNA-3-methyladenine glycosylase 2 family protein [Sabulicella rubraurantiaca]
MDPFTSLPSASAPPSEPPWFREGIAALIATEPRFAQIALPVPFVAREGGFRGLLRTICGQQVSHAAAGAIWRRLSAIPGALDPAILPEMDDDTLCGLGGLTRSRAAHARALARAVRDGALDFAALARLGDDAAVATLTAVKGIGPWTAETHLVLSELRTDVFPAGDIALAAGAAHLLDLPARPSPTALREIALGWAPWRGVAARMLWHHWLLVTGRPVWDRD